MTGARLTTLIVLTLAPALARAQPGGEEPVDLELEPDDAPAPDDDAPPDVDLPGDEAPPADDGAPVARDPKLARKLADGAAKFARKGDRLKRRKKDAEAQAEYDRAIAAYEKSFEMHPDPKVLVLAAAIDARAGRWLEAASRYERALAATEIPLDERGRASAQAALDDAHAHLGMVAMNVTPDGATIAIDGVDVGTAPLPKPLWLAPGEYAVTIRADGYVTLEAKLVAEEGSESERLFELQPVPVVVKPPRPPPPPPPPLPDPPSKLLLYGGAGATALFTGLAVTTGVMALGEHGTFHDDGATAAAREDAQASGRRLTKMTDAFAAGALIAAGATAYYYLKIYKPGSARYERAAREREEMHDEYSERRRRRATPRVVVVPSVEAGGGGLVIGGWF